MATGDPSNFKIDNALAGNSLTGWNSTDAHEWITGATISGTGVVGGSGGETGTFTITMSGNTSAGLGVSGGTGVYYDGTQWVGNWVDPERHALKQGWLFNKRALPPGDLFDEYAEHRE
jgi:hypothetical protein